MLEVRCSSLPRLSSCAASVVSPELRIESPRDAADLGSAFHAVMCIRLGGPGKDIYPDDPTADVAAEFNVDAEDLAPLAGWAWKLWRERLAEHFPAPLVEHPLRAEDAEAGLALNGHPDVIALAGDEVRGLDWKTGWLSSDATEQLKGYAMLGLLRWPEAKTARMSVLRVREHRVETFAWSRDELLGWWGWLARHLAGADIFRPGSHCGYCPRALECPAHQQALRAVAAMVDVVQPQELDANDLALGVERVRILKRRAEEWLDQAKAQVIARGGEYGPLAIKEEKRRSIDVVRGMDLLKEAIGEKTLMPLLKVSKGDVEDEVKRNLPRGQKGHAVKHLMDRLESAGALSVTTIQKLEVNTRGTTSSTRGPAIAAADERSAVDA